MIVDLEIASTTNAVLVAIALNPALQVQTVQKAHTVRLSKTLKARALVNGAYSNAAPHSNANETLSA